MPDTSPPLPAIVRHYAAYLRAKAHITPEASVSGGKADVAISIGEKTLVLIFVLRKKKWSLRKVEVRHGHQTDSFTRDELAKAVAALLGSQALTSSKPVIGGTSGPRTDARLREKRNTVIRI